MLAKSFARIQRRNLIAQGIVALTFANAADYERAEVEQCWTLPEFRRELSEGTATITARIEDSGEQLSLAHDFSEHEREILIAGGLLACLRNQDGDPQRAHRAASSRA